MHIKKEKIKKIYCIDNGNSMHKKDFDNLLMVGTKTWNLYFTSNVAKKEKVVSVDKDVTFVEFDKKKELFDYLKTIKRKDLIDFSLEHDKPCALIACI